MPKRPEIKKEAIPYEYDELLRFIRSHIDAEFGGVSKFLDSPTFEELGFPTDDKEKRKMFTYLSLPAEGEKKKVKSVPILAKLFRGLLEVELESKMKIVRTQLITSNKELDFKAT